MRTLTTACHFAITLQLTTLAACSGGGQAPPAAEPNPDTTDTSPNEPAASTAAAATPATPTFADPLTRVSRVDGSTFIEIGEVRARDDGMLFYCTGVRGLQIVDARDPASTKVVSEPRSALGHKRFHRCQHLAWSGDTIYFVNRGDRIQPTPFVSAFDLSQSPPVEVATYSKKGRTFEGIAAANDLIFVAMHNAGLAILQRKGKRIVERAVLRKGLGTAWGVAVDGNRVYVTDAKGGLAIVDVTKPRRPKLLGRVTIDGSAQSVAISGNTAYVAATSAGLVSVDVSNPKAPTVLATVESSGTALQVSVSGDRALVANWSDARVYDIADAKKPTLLAIERVQTDESFSRVLGAALRGNDVFIGEWTGMYRYRLGAPEPTPALGITEPSIDFSRVAPGKQLSETLIIENEGTAPLTVTQFSTYLVAAKSRHEKKPTKSGNESRPAGPNPFTVDTKPMTIAPGALASVQVTFAPMDTNQRTAELRIESNDPGQSTRTIPIVANRKGLGVGDAAPAMSVDLVSGGHGDLDVSSLRGKVVLLAYFATF